MRMRAHIDGTRNARRHVERPHMIEEDERPDHPPLGGGEDTPDVKPAEVAAPLRDYHFNHVGSSRVRLSFVRLLTPYRLDRFANECTPIDMELSAGGAGPSASATW